MLTIIFLFSFYSQILQPFNSDNKMGILLLLLLFLRPVPISEFYHVERQIFFTPNTTFPVLISSLQATPGTKV